MSRTTRRPDRAALAGLAAAVALATAAAPSHARAQTRAADATLLNGAGSTFILPLMKAWTTAYAPIDKSVRINYQGIGSGAGVTAFTQKSVDFAGSDAFLSDAQIKALGGNEVHIPMTIGPVALLYNLPGVTDRIKLDGPALAQIFLGKVTTWNDQVIATLNPTVNLPDTPIAVVHRSDGSGTSFIFTNFLKATSPDWAKRVGAGAAVNWPAGQGGKGTAGVAAIVKSTPGAIGYAELSYAVTVSLPTLLIKNKAGQFVAASPAGAAADAANAQLPDDLRALIVDGTGSAAYPITGFSWVIVHQTVGSAAEAAKYTPLLKFLWWAVHKGQQGIPTSGKLRYAPLPPAVVTADEGQIRSITYNGNPVYQG